MRTREEQIADIVSCLRFDNSGFASQTLTHIAEKFIEEAENRVKVVPASSVDPQVLVASHEMTDEQKKHPEWVWLNPDTKEMSFGRWSRVSGNHAPYIRADLAIEAERRAEQRVRAEIGRALDKACETVMGIETPAMKGDNLAVTLCSYFEDCEGEADDNGWHPKAVEGYDQVKSAIAQHFRSAIDAAREMKE